jgi:hypothetical protein
MAGTSPALANALAKDLCQFGERKKEEEKEKRLLMKRINVIAGLIALIVSAGFLYLALTPPSMFNFLPFAIHEALFLKVTEGGEVSSSIEEGTFIKIFDIVFAGMLFWLIYKVSKSLMKS